MPIVIILLSTIVGFIFGGPVLAVAVLLIGLAIIFPNTFGAIAAVIGAIILLSVISVKFDIDADKLILWICIIFLILVAIAFIMDSDMANPQRAKNKAEIANLKKKTQERNKVSPVDLNMIDTKKKSVPSVDNEQTLGSSTLSSVADELLKLKALKDDGIITEKEFDTQKNKLLK